jgi:hypothetical protein
MGQKRAGKDTLAGFLIEEHGFVRLAFADRLREALLEIDPLVGRGDLRVSDVISSVGWEGAKGLPAGVEIRRLLQHVGVTARGLREDVWAAPVVEAAQKIRSGGILREVPAPVVVTDVRFPDEADAIRAAGGKIVRVDRPGLPDDDGHVSEHAWRDVEPDFLVLNDGSLDDLRAKAKILAV